MNIAVKRGVELAPNKAMSAQDKSSQLEPLLIRDASRRERETPLGPANRNRREKSGGLRFQAPSRALQAPDDVFRGGAALRRGADRMHGLT